MRRIIAVLALATLTTTCEGSEKDARAIVEKAIKAHGGKDKLSKVLVCNRKDSVKLGDQAWTSLVSRSLPDKLRLTMSSKRVKTVVVINGDKGWFSDGGPSREMLKPRLGEIKDEMYVWYLTTLTPLLNKPFLLDTIADKKVGGETLVGVKVTSKGHEDSKLYFSKKTGLLARIERLGREAGLKIDKAYIYSGYKEFSGIQLPTTEEMQLNGMKYLVTSIGDYTFPTKMDSKLFTKP